MGGGIILLMASNSIVLPGPPGAPTAWRLGCTAGTTAPGIVVFMAEVGVTMMVLQATTPPWWWTGRGGRSRRGRGRGRGGTRLGLAAEELLLAQTQLVRGVGRFPNAAGLRVRGHVGARFPVTGLPPGLELDGQAWADGTRAVGERRCGADRAGGNGRQRTRVEARQPESASATAMPTVVVRTNQLASSVDRFTECYDQHDPALPHRVRHRWPARSPSPCTSSGRACRCRGSAARSPGRSRAARARRGSAGRVGRGASRPLAAVVVQRQVQHDETLALFASGIAVTTHARSLLSNTW